MIRYHVALAPKSIAVAIALAALTSPSIYGQAPPEKNERDVVTVPAKGMEIFRYALHKKDITPLSGLDDIDPAKTMIILMGEESVRRFANDAKVLAAVRNGASLLIASNGGDEEHLREYGVQLLKDRVEADEEHSYERKKRNPFVQPILQPSADPKTAEFIFQELGSSGSSALATNNPTVLRIIGRERNVPLQALARYPESARFSSDRQQLNPQRDLFAVAGHFPYSRGQHPNPGRFMILADHSIFENIMVWQQNNANRFFMLDCREWLQGNEMKSMCLFVEDGKVRTQFDLRAPEKPLDLWKFLAMMRHIVNKGGNQLIEETQQQNVYNRVLFEYFGLTPHSVLRSLLIGISVFALLVGFVALVRVRMRADPARALITPQLAALIPRHGTLKQRFDGQLDSNNVYEPVRDLIREFMTGMDAEPDSGGRPPQILIEDGYQGPSALRRRIMRLWTIGFGAEPVKVPPSQWSKLYEDLQGVLQDADEGWWRFVAGK